MSVSASYRFDRIEVLPAARKLLVDGRPVVVGGRALDLLLTLIEHRERMLTKDELLERVWPHAAVEPNNLAVQIGALRKLLGPDAIATIPGRGYKFGVALDALPETPAAAPAPDAPATSPPRTQLKTNLPATPTPLIGRAAQAAALEALLDRHALVTITGAGGIGKSVLAQHLLHRRRDAYAHGVCWVDLSAVSEPAALPGTVAAALGVQLGAGDPAAALRSALAPLAMLVALDNAEHLLEGVSTLVASLHGTAPTLRLVVTSQAPLRLAQEQVYRLDALAVPPGPASAVEALGYGAVALFVDRAKAVDARFLFSDTNAAAVIDLCGRLDGMPLAIELAAARAPVLGVQRVADSLGERLRLLTGGRRNAPARQQTLRAALDWSHGLLSADERVVFRRLAVIAGSSSLEVIQRVAADDESEAGPEALDRWGVVDALSGLIDRSLVAISPEGDDPERPRYRLLDSPRAYAEERLREAGERERLAERHARALGHRLEAAWEERWSGRIGADAWRRDIALDRDNARIAIAWALARRDLPLVWKMTPVLLLRGGIREWSSNERAPLVEAIESLLAATTPTSAQMLTWFVVGLFWNDTHPHRALTAARTALDLARDSSDRFAVYVSLSVVARSAMLAGEVDLAAASLAESLAIEDPSWPPHRRFWRAETEALFASVRGNDGSTPGLIGWRKVLELLQAAGDSAFGVRSNLVDAELAVGDAAAAVASGRVLVEMLAQTRDAFTLSAARANLMAALLVQGDLAAARPVAEAGWEKAVGFNLHPFYGDYLAFLAALEGRWVVAARLAGFANAAYSEQNLPRWPNERRAHERTMALVESALGKAECERLMADGMLLPGAQVTDLAFGTDVAK